MRSIAFKRTQFDYQTNTEKTFDGTITEGSSYLINYRDEETFAGIVSDIFLDPDGDEMIEIDRPNGKTEFIYAKGIYSLEEIK